MAEPTNQRFLRISLFLKHPEPGGRDFAMVLPINPEELTRNETVRASVVNSLDGAWVDSFGRGLTTLTISGNTGWRAAMKVINPNEYDGSTRYLVLRDMIFMRWHELRREQIEKGKDPNNVRLFFIDALNHRYVGEVVITNFVLRRSKSQPLLFMYSITMVVINDAAASPNPALLLPILPPVTPVSFLSSLMSSASAITSLLNSAAGFFARLGPLGVAALNLINGSILPAISRAMDLVRLASSIGASIGLLERAAIAAAAALAATGVAAMNAITSMPGLPADAMAAFTAIKSKLSNMSITLSIGIPMPSFPSLPGLP